MTPQRRNTDTAVSDHDLLVRIDEKLLNLVTTFKEHADKTDLKLDKLTKEKADKAEIQELKSLLEDRYDASVKPFIASASDHESRVRKLEQIAFKFGGALLLAQIAFNVWIGIISR